MGKGWEYKVRWKDTSLCKSALENAQGMLRKFEARQMLSMER